MNSRNSSGKTKPIFISIILGCVLLIAGVLLFSGLHISTDNPQFTQGKHQLTLHSHFARTASANIITGRDIASMTLNGQPVQVSYNYPKTRVSHQDAEFGSVYSLPLQAGSNTLTIQHTQEDNRLSVRFAQHFGFWYYLLFFCTILLPLGSAILFVGFKLINKLLAVDFPHSTPIRLGKQYANTLMCIPLILVILALGVMLRLWYAIDMGYIQFQHDYHGHVEYIEFFAREFFIPLPHKAWEFPQQPIYYIFNGSLYALLDALSISKASILKIISASTAMLSCVGLFYAMKLMQLLSNDRFVHCVSMSFLCFTPSLIYMSSRINNDPWAMALACIALYYIVASYQEKWTRFFYRALLFTSLLFLTKVSSLVIELIFFGLLITSYITQANARRSPLFFYSIVGLLILGYTLYRGYYPAAAKMALVNSGIWGGQDLRPLGLHYFFSFNFAELLVEAQGRITGSDNHIITRSFPTYHYITMIFGEFDYTWWRNNNPSLYHTMQTAVILALIVPLGWLGYIFKQKSLIDWLFIAAVAAAFFLLIKFIITYPSVSNTDFRYHAAIMAILAYFFASGLEVVVNRFSKYRRFFYIWLGVLFTTYVYYMLLLIRM